MLRFNCHSICQQYLYFSLPLVCMQTNTKQVGTMCNHGNKQAKSSQKIKKLNSEQLLV